MVIYEARKYLQLRFFLFFMLMKLENLRKMKLSSFSNIFIVKTSSFPCYIGGDAER